jgi:dTDP-4-dehydrorhamnose 3,5-epimerase
MSVAENGLIEGVSVKKLRVIPDERGRLMEILRSDDDVFTRFGQVYVTTGYPGVVKAWHYHTKQTDNFCVVHGMMKIVLCDSRTESSTFGLVNEFFAGEHNPILITIPPLVFHGFKTISDKEAVLINVPTEVYDYAHPDEHRIEPYSSEVPYDWARRDG